MFTASMKQMNTSKLHSFQKGTLQADLLRVPYINRN